MNVMLGDVNIEMVEAVLIESALLGARPHIRCHGVRNDRPCRLEMFSYDFGQCWVLAIRDVIEGWNARLTTE